jgi:hypothetical protein
VGTWDIWTERATTGYGGKGAKPRGYEHHVVSFGRSPRLVAEVAFENFGVTRYTIDASGGARPRSVFRYADGLSVSCQWRNGSWVGRGDDGGDATEFALDVSVPDGATAVPSMLARWLGVGSKESEGVVARYVPLPEDGFGAWRPPRKQWFPVMNARPATVCEVAIAPVEEIQAGRTRMAVRPLVHRNTEGTEVARLLLDPESGAPVRYEQLGCVLTVVDEARARARAPKS